MPNQKSGIDWNEVGDLKDLVIFSAVNPYYRLLIVKFTGMKEVEIKDKISNQFSFEVKDLTDGKTKEWNIVSKRLLVKLRDFEPLIGKGLEVKKIGTGFESDYMLTEIKKVE